MRCFLRGLAFFLIVSCSSSSLVQMDKDKLLSKTWIVQEMKDGVEKNTKLINKHAFKFTQNSATITSLCRYFDADGNDTKSFFVSASGPVSFNESFDELVVEKRISKMESEKVATKDRVRAQEFLYYECYAELNEGRFKLAYDKKSKNIVMTPVSEPINLKEQ